MRASGMGVLKRAKEFGAFGNLKKKSLPESEEKGMPDYQQGKIYALRSPKTPNVYIGSTTVSLAKRLGQHKASKNTCTSRQIVDAGDCYIELLEACPCESKEQLNRREGEVMRSTANCINRNIAVAVSDISTKRGYIVYVEEEFFLIVSEIDKKTHKVPRNGTLSIPPTVCIDGKDLQLSHVPITESRLFSACREYIYDRERRSPVY
jgi:hypothetical protein